MNKARFAGFICFVGCAGWVEHSGAYQFISCSRYLAKEAFETARDSSHNHEEFLRTTPAQLFRQSVLVQLSNAHQGDEENDDYL
jgi:hypothetical protein